MKLREALSGIASVRDEVARLTRLDGWINAITGLGGARDRTTRATVAPIVPLTPAALEALYHTNDLAAKITDKIVREGLRQGFTIAGDDDGDLLGALRRWRVPQRALEAAIWGRLYGAGAVLIGTTEAPMDTPLEIERLGPNSLAYLTVLDRTGFTIAARDGDPLSQRYGQPDVYRISESGTLVHASRMVLFGGALTAETVRRRNDGYDLSVLQRPHDVLRDADQSWRSVMLLLQDLSLAVFKVHGLIDMIAEGEKDTMLARMEVVDMGRSVARAVVIDAEHEEFEHKGAANVTGIEPALMMTFRRLASAADMPLTVFLGTSPGGLNATGESDTRHWYDVIQSYRDDELGPALSVLAQVVAASEGAPIEEPEIEWPSLWQPSPKEQAELDKLDAETDKVRIDSGVLEPEEVTIAKFQDDPLYADVIDFDARAEALAAPEPEPLLLPPGMPPVPPGAPPPPQPPPGQPEGA